MKKYALKFTGIVICWLLGVSLAQAATTSITISWDAIQDSDVASYNILWGTAPKSYTNSLNVGNVTQVTLSLDSSQTYFLAVQGVDTQGVAGDISAEVSPAFVVGKTAQPSSNAIFLPMVEEDTTFRTNIGIDNPSTSTANVDVVLVDASGVVVAYSMVQVPAQGMLQINKAVNSIYPASVDAAWTGTVFLESDQTVNAWASKILNDNSDPNMYSSKKTGATQLLIPSAVNTSLLTSSLVLLNLGSSDASVSMTAYTTSGTVLGQQSTGLTVPAHGTLSFDNVMQSLGVSGQYGPLAISSLNSMPLLAFSRVSSTDGTGGFFEGIDYQQAGTTQVIPQLLENSDIRTNFGIDNVSSTQATVAVKLIGKDGVQLGSSSFSVPANGLTQVNSSVIRSLFGLDDSSDIECSVNFQSDQSILAWVSMIDNTTSDPSMMTSKGTGSSHVMIQSAINNSSWSSSLALTNPGSTDAYVDLVSRDSSGNVLGQLLSVLIPAGGMYSSENILQDLNVSDNYGPLEITSTNGQALLVNSRVVSSIGTSGFFEGQSIQ